MQVVIRADASLQMGTGHIIRCLTLAQALQEKGALVNFICREHLGDLIEFIETKGFKVHRLPLHEQGVISEQSDEPLINRASTQQPCLKSTKSGQLVTNTLFHSHWLGSTQYQDAQDCMDVLKTLNPDWLITDHYALDETWQVLLEDYYHKLMVIDDLADRKHQCNLLLDLTFGRKPEDYQALVPENCQMLLGSQYTLLRPEFAQWREYSLKRRVNPEFKKLLITMGGVDPDNITSQVLETLKTCILPKEMEITVIIGATAPHIDTVKTQAKAMPCKTHVKINVDNMAEIMANSDFAIGASGGTTWERCCLGLPSLLWVLADNQKTIAKNLVERKIVRLFDSFDQICSLLRMLGENLVEYSANAALVSDGKGVEKVVKAIYEE